MPYSAKQIRLFQAAAHNPAIAKSSGIPQKKAAVLLRHSKSPVKKHAMKD